MKIILTGGGTGGHFYPLIAVAEELQNVSAEKNILPPELFFLAPAPYNEAILAEHKINFIKIPAGKIRRYATIQNITDAFVTLKGFLKALWVVFRIYPDVVFAKGGFGSFPTLLAARILFIPIMIHDSDSKPGIVNAWAGKFADRVALSYPDAVNYFKKADTKGRVAWTGNPIRKEITEPIKEGSFETFGLEKNIPVILILGGSQGAQVINDAILDTLPYLLEEYQVIHQAGPKNFDAVKGQSEVTLERNPNKGRYKPFAYLTEDMMRRAAGVTSLVVSRAGSTIFEIAAWGLPSIIVPIPEKTSHDQRTNAYNYKRSGSCSVIEEENLRPEIIFAEVNRIMKHEDVKNAMIESTKKFARIDAGKTIAEALIDIGLSHEK
ncbi:MAG: UDP-N-acetylglucosamine--N-acetylmuramyl-(pentapeptide) pyrophosphoryl-undecaprenol N-acetylglucosamine transferase [Candidatus Paceibacterota bacterium]|jgi:UDP-N-acetylglucosamine--N-acetylmuramyl-(pentapeptide) pyrophosphoryl-undecaprenol N-acetylglucosamine transferase